MRFDLFISNPFFYQFHDTNFRFLAFKIFFIVDKYRHLLVQYRLLFHLHQRFLPNDKAIECVCFIAF